MGKMVDQEALDLMPADYAGSTIRFPVNIYGDGNCLPRCASVFAFGTETDENLIEIRMRIVHELVVNEEKYTDNSFLSIGIEQYGQDDLPKIYTQYADTYKLGEKVTDAKIKQVYRSEVLVIRQDKEFMGIWQIHALSNILGCPIQSVYPEYAGYTVRQHLHRKIVPVQPKTAQQIFIMWTNTRGKEREEALWNPNHFVVLLPIDCPQKDSDVEVSV